MPGQRDAALDAAENEDEPIAPVAQEENSEEQEEAEEAVDAEAQATDAEDSQADDGAAEDRDAEDEQSEREEAEDEPEPQAQTRPPVKPQAQASRPQPPVQIASFEQEMVRQGKQLPERDRSGNLLYPTGEKDEQGNALVWPVDPVTGQWVLTDEHWAAKLANFDADGEPIPPTAAQIATVSREQQEYFAERQARLSRFQASVRAATEHERTVAKTAIDSLPLPKDSKARKILSEVYAAAEKDFDSIDPRSRPQGAFDLAMGYNFHKRIAEYTEAVQSGATVAATERAVQGKRTVATSGGRTSAAQAQSALPVNVPKFVTVGGKQYSTADLARQNGMEPKEWYREYKQRKSE